MHFRKLGALFCASMITCAQSLPASGFYLIEQSVSSMGTAYAGAAAVAEDSTTIFFNPAGMTRLCHAEVALGGHLVMPSAHFHDDGSKINPPQVPIPLNGGDGGNAGDVGFVPNFYYVQPCGAGLVLGLGINAPFGLSTSYDNDWKGRYYGVKSELLSININPSVAYKVLNCLSIGAGFDAMYINAKLTNKVDFGYIGTQNPAFSQKADGFAKLTGDSWALGFNLGVLYEHSECTRIGIAYRSGMTQDIGGQVRFKDVPEPLSGIFKNAKATTTLDLPALVSLSLYHQLNSCIAILADVSWTNWDVLEKVIFKFKSDQPDTILNFDWKNSWRYSLGMTYRPSCNFILRMGVAYDETPVPNKELRSPRIPDEDRIWLALGGGYNFNQCIVFDIGYAHLFVRDPVIAREGTANPANPDFFLGELRGDYSAHTDIVSAQVRYLF
jgi:long-chain fatty acid transport protein